MSIWETKRIVAIDRELLFQGKLRNKHNTRMTELCTSCFNKKNIYSKNSVTTFSLTYSNDLNPFLHTINMQQTTSNFFVEKYGKSLYIKKCGFRKEFKTLWQKDKMLIMSNFSFCHNVFKS